MSDDHEPARGPAGRHWIVAGVFGAAMLYYLVSEHRAHLIGALPWLILLACPLLHVFMHGRHRGHDGHDSPRQPGDGA
ncbi:MAG: DUF2933 domain-containing protein [Rhodospirillaceae bacterium]|nr:DUF2933 domain-containing protein [Rhodospirillaceae bacterium]